MNFGVSLKGSWHAWKMGRTVQQIDATGDAFEYISTAEARLSMMGPAPDLVGKVFCQEDTGELFLYVSSDLEPAEERWVKIQIESVP